MLIGDRWKVLDNKRTAERDHEIRQLRKAVGEVSPKVLTANLRSMEEDGLLVRTVYAEVPPRVEYTLTETGYSLKLVLDAMGAWGTNYKS